MDDTKTSEAPPGAGQTARGILHRKTATARSAQEARAISLQKAFRLTLAKVANDTLDLALAALSIKVDSHAGDDVEDLFDDDALLMLLDGPTGHPGAVMLDSDLVGALIQQQTMSAVLPAPEGEPRPMTDTDAAICAPFVDRVMARATLLPDDPVEREMLRGYAFGARAEDGRQLTLSLAAERYHVLDVTLDIAGGVRQGRMMLCLPVPGQRRAIPPEDAVDTPAPAGPTGAMMADTALALNVDLSISLKRLRMPVRRLGQLRTGDTLDLGAVDFNRVAVMTDDGRTLVTGSLGQLDGRRAVRLEDRQGAGGTSEAAEPSQRGAGTVADMTHDGASKPDMQTPGTQVSEPAELEDAMPDMSDLDLPDLDTGLDDDPETDLPTLEDTAEGLPQLDDPQWDEPAGDDLPALGDPTDLPDLDGDAALQDIDLPDIDLPDQQAG